MHGMHLRLLHQRSRGTRSSRPHTCHQSRSRCRCQRCRCHGGQAGMLRSHMLRLSGQSSTHAARQNAPHSRRWGRQTITNSSHLHLRSSQWCADFRHIWFQEDPYKPSDGRLVWYGLRAFPRTLRHRRRSNRTTSSSRSRKVAPAVPALRRLMSSLHIAAVIPRLLSSQSLRATSPATRQDSHSTPNNQRVLIAGRRRYSRGHSGRNTRVHGSGRTVTTVTATTAATLGRETAPMD